MTTRRRAPSSEQTNGRRLDIGVFGGRSIPSTYSGYETFLTTLLPCLAERGHQVTMYCRKGETSGAGPYRHVRRVALPALPGKQLNTLSHGALAAARARLANHDVLLVVNVANALTCGLNTYTGQPVLLNTDGQEWLRGKWGRAARSYFLLSARIAKYCSTGLISDCAAMADLYERDFGAASTVIPYCFPSERSDPDPRFLGRFGVSRGGYTVVAGRLNPENNIDTVAEAYTRTAASIPLLVLGTANYASPVQARLDDLQRTDSRIRLIGHVGDRREFLSLVGLAGAYIHGHSVGGMNPSLVEAMGSGALIAALDTPFNRETLGDSGHYFSEGGADLGDVLATLISLPEKERNTLSAAAVGRVRDQFGLTDVVDAYEALLKAGALRRTRRQLVVQTRWSR